MLWSVARAGVIVGLVGCVSDPPIDEERASLDVQLEYVGEEVVASFSAIVPDGADNVQIWFGDGQISEGALDPTHTYVVNAPYMASLFYDDPLGGGRANAEVTIDELPVPLHALALPEGPATHLVATNHRIFLHNYEGNEPAHTMLRGSEAFAFSVDAQGVASAVADVTIDFYPSRDVLDATPVALDVQGDRAWADFADEPHVLIPGWAVAGERVAEGGFTMPTVSRTEAPEPDVPHFLTNAEFSMDEDLVIRLRLPVGGGAHGLVYTLVGSDGTVQRVVETPREKASVTVSSAELASVGSGVVGLFTVLYSEVREGEFVMRNNSVGYAPIRLIEGGE